MFFMGLHKAIDRFQSNAGIQLLLTAFNVVDLLLTRKLIRFRPSPRRELIVINRISRMMILWDNIVLLGVRPLLSNSLILILVLILIKHLVSQKFVVDFYQ